MATLITWGPGLATGVDIIDRDHRKLVDMLNRLHAAMSEGHAKEVLGGLLDDLVSYTVQHFAHEEQMMKQIGYKAAAAHINEHKKLIAEVTEFKRKLGSGQAMISLELMRSLKAWLSNHIMASDQALAKEILAANAAAPRG